LDWHWWLALWLSWSSSTLWATDRATAGREFHNKVQPLLNKYCSDCHLDGEKKGGVAFDELGSDRQTTDNYALWLAVLKNVRTGLMPPPKKAQPTLEEKAVLEQWIKYQAFDLDPRNPPAGKVTVRRLNRAEYRNTIRDLMGIDFKADEEFPPDDTGFGFDTIGDVLTVSPLLLEKYIVAAKAIVAQAVPLVDRQMAEKVIAGNTFRATDTNIVKEGKNFGRKDGLLSLSYYQAAEGTNSFNLEHSGSYRLGVEMAVRGTFDYDPGRCNVVIQLDGQELLRKEFAWYDYKLLHFDLERSLQAGDHSLSIAVEPLVPVAKKLNSLDIHLLSLKVRGPTEPTYWVRPPAYARFFGAAIPEGRFARRKYARTLLADLTRRAYRRPADERTVDRLAAFAESDYRKPGVSFESGMAHAMVAILSSPRFLFRMEQNEPTSSVVGGNVQVDEYALASRLSYFLWSTMPDETLFQLAGRHELRPNLNAQVKRMLEDKRADAMIRNFTGQWLQVRDVEGTSIDARVVLARDSGSEKQMRQEREAFLARLAQQNTTTNKPQASGTGGTNSSTPPRPRFTKPRIELDLELRQALQKETEMFVGSVFREDRSVTELLDSDYTFLNEKLGTLYGMTNVTGAEMRRVSLPAGSPRGGVLTEGSVLVVTSNPDRTSPVKRGLFVLDNILGMPPPPPPPNIPALEAAEKGASDHEPLLREMLALHRDKPLCASCHNRMDPIGLAFENFNAMGLWRDKERNQAIDATGKLASGETFASIHELKRILIVRHRPEFYRCLTEKLMTYALGRGLEYYDVETVDQIVNRLEKNNGRFSELLQGVIESAPFQKVQPLPASSTALSRERVDNQRPAKSPTL
jgi:hypothetical protein